MANTETATAVDSKQLNCSGFFKIWRVNKETGNRELLVDKKNMILYGGADLMAQALAGVRYAKISHMYIGYKTTASLGAFTPPTIDKEYSNQFSDYNTTGLEDLGYLRLPLAFTPTYLASTNYENNTVVFTAVVSSSAEAQGGAIFADSGEAAPSHIFEVALVAALDPTGSGQDKIFSRANFDPIVFDSNYNLTISWGVQFLA